MNKDTKNNGRNLKEKEENKKPKKRRTDDTQKCRTDKKDNREPETDKCQRPRWCRRKTGLRTLGTKVKKSWSQKRGRRSGGGGGV